jgi:hypothetical protein
MNIIIRPELKEKKVFMLKVKNNLTKKNLMSDIHNKHGDQMKNEKLKRIGKIIIHINEDFQKNIQYELKCVKFNEVKDNPIDFIYGEKTKSIHEDLRSENEDLIKTNKTFLKNQRIKNDFVNMGDSSDSNDFKMNQIDLRDDIFLQKFKKINNFIKNSTANTKNILGSTKNDFRNSNENNYELKGKSNLKVNLISQDKGRRNKTFL